MNFIERKLENVEMEEGKIISGKVTDQKILRFLACNLFDKYYIIKQTSEEVAVLRNPDNSEEGEDHLTFFF